VIRTAVALAAAISKRSPLASVFATRVTSVPGAAIRPTNRADETEPRR
jgi:hypothetical protein